MSNAPTHAEVLAAIDKARRTSEGKYGLIAQDWLDDRSAHCDDLRATAERHAPSSIYAGECSAHRATSTGGTHWPCADYQQVIDRLTGWGVL
jgi:hypothetical protein